MGRDNAARGNSVRELGGTFAPNRRLSIPLISDGLPLRSADRTP